MNTRKGYLGTYASPESAGIYQFSLDVETGALSMPELYYMAADSKYLSLYTPPNVCEGDFPHAPPSTCEGDFPHHGILVSSTYQHTPPNAGEGDLPHGKGGVCLIDTGSRGGRLLGSAYHETNAACYVTQDESFIYTANYHEGSILIYSKEKGKPELVKRIDIAPKAGCHQILFHHHFMMVPCLLLDKIVIYDCDQDFAPVGELVFPKGTGPRHGIFDKKQERFYLVSELSNELFVYRVLPEMEFQLAQVCSFLPGDRMYEENPISAAVRLSLDERFLYISTRFADLITVFRLEGTHAECIQQTGCGGKYPRDFILAECEESPLRTCSAECGAFLLVVNKMEGGLVSFRLNRESGKLEELCSRVPAPEAVCIVLERLVTQL